MKILVIILLALFIFFDIALDFYISDLDIFTLNDSQTQIHWLLTRVRGIALQAAASLAIFASIWQFPQATNKLLACSAVVLSIGFSACYTYQSYTGMQATALLSNKEFAFSSESKAVSRNIAQILESEDKSPEEKTETSNFYASRVYVESEKIINVIDLGGKLIPFTPDQKTLKKRALFTEAEETINSSNSAFTTNFYQWLAILCGSTLAGLIGLGFRRRYQQ